MFKEFIHSRLQADEISDVLQSRDYAMRFYFKDLSVAILGAGSKDHVTVSRYYLTLDPKVIVDFEPHPLDGKFHVEPRRKYFLDHRMIYIPVFLKDRLTIPQFEERVREAREFTARGVWEQKIDIELSEVEVDGVLLTPEAELWVNREVHARFLTHKANHKKPDLLKGFVEQAIKGRLKKELIHELRGRIKTHGRVGAFNSTRDVAVSTR